MKNVDTLINHLEANARDELAAQEGILKLLHEQERAIVEGKTELVAELAKRLQGESANASRRAGTRQQVLKAIANAWSVPVGAMTLGSIAERAGQRGDRLLHLRTSLREKASEVLRKNRRVAAVARLHHHVVREVIDTILTDESGSSVQENPAGALIDAEA